MAQALTGEIVGPAATTVAQTSRRTAERLGELRYVVHSVDLPNGGRVEGMGQEDALRMARQLGTRAYRAMAVLVTRGRQAGLVVMSPLERLL